LIYYAGVIVYFG